MMPTSHYIHANVIINRHDAGYKQKVSDSSFQKYRNNVLREKIILS